MNEMDFESCWNTGEYDGQMCDLCPHNSECSGYEEEDE